MNDQEEIWIQQARSGDKRAFSRLVEAYQGPVFSLTCVVCWGTRRRPKMQRRKHSARLFELAAIRPSHKFSRCFSIANYCIDRLRKRR